MALDTITKTFTGAAYTHSQCWCGISFALPEMLHRHYLRENELRPRTFSIYCPLGHPMVPGDATPAEQEAKRLRDELAAEKHRREQAQARADYHQAENERVTRSLRGTRAVVTRMKRRTAKGRCPCCSHEFKDLKRHMQTRHPKWEPLNGAEAMASVPRYAKGAP